MKKSFIVVTTLISLSVLSVNAANLVQMDMKKSSDNTVDVTFYTTGSASNPMVTRKSDNKYVVLMPNVSGSNTSAPDFSKLKDIIADVNVKNVDDGVAGYTKVTIITTKPLNINTHTQKAANVTNEEKAAKSIIAQVKTTPTIINTQTNTTTSQNVTAKNTTSMQKEVVKTVAKKDEKIVSLGNKNITKNISTKKAVSPKVVVPAKETVQNTTVVPNNVTEEINNNENVVSQEGASQQVQPLINQNIPSTMNTHNKKLILFLLVTLPLLLLYVFSKMLKNSISSSKKAESSANHGEQEVIVNSSDKYSDIISDSSANWQEKYKKFMEQTQTNVNKNKYSFITMHDTLTNTDKKRLELENTIKQTPDIYKDQQIDISNNPFKEVISEDEMIQEDIDEIKLKAFAKPASLTSSKRAYVSKLLPKFSHAKEGKFIKLFETPLNTTSRKFKNANLKVSDLISTSNKYLSEEEKGMINSDDYLMSSMDEYFSLLDKEQSRKVSTATMDLSQRVADSLANIKPSLKSSSHKTIGRISNPISQKSDKHLSGLIIKETYNIDENRSFHIVNLDGVSALIGRIKDDIFVIKDFSSSVSGLQVRLDNENVYMVKAGNFKSLVDANNMGVLIEL